MTQKTYWNGEPAVCRRVRVRVGKSERPTWWCAKLEGTERNAVEIRYGGQTFYIDDDDAPDGLYNAGVGWWKVTEGRGGPDCLHSSLPVAEVLVSVCQEGGTVPQ